MTKKDQNKKEKPNPAHSGNVLTSYTKRKYKRTNLNNITK